MKPLHILIAEDNADLREGLKIVLEGEGYKVTTVSNGENAISSYEKNQFDLIFMDVKLPGMDGIEAFMNILNIDPDAKVVIMTGYRIDQLLSEIQDRWALSVLRKPFQIEQVLDLIESL